METIFLDCIKLMNSQGMYVDFYVAMFSFINLYRI